jgi:hypothetical protein
MAESKRAMMPRIGELKKMLSGRILVSGLKAL